MVGVAATAGALRATKAEAQVLRMKFAHFADEGHPGHLAAKMFVENVEKRTNGQIKIDIFPNNQLGSPPEQAEQIRLGATDMGLPTQGQFDKWVKAMGAVMLPFAYDDYDHVHRTVDGPAFQWFGELVGKEGFVLLSNWEYGFRNRGLPGPGGPDRRHRLPRAVHGPGPGRGRRRG
jgi:TRAP-type C4-dicarboxylate transport system substrate-binding protein